jgi:hypothetical protein
MLLIDELAAQFGRGYFRGVLLLGKAEDDYVDVVLTIAIGV